MSFRLFQYSLCLGLLLAGMGASGQVNYSAQDLATIQQKRKQTQQALDTWDRKALYRLGLFYETIYKKYADTSMRAAIHCYEASAFTEGDLFNEESLLAALHLGQIFEQGTGVPVQTEKAMIYYFVSGNKGSKEFSRLRQIRCPADTVIYNSIGRQHPIDSLVIGVDPFCSLRSAATGKALDLLAEFLKHEPEWQVQLLARYAGPGITAPYNLWVQTEALPRRCVEIRNYLVEQAGIAPERILNAAVPVETGGEHHMVIITVLRREYL
jgi:hypothetical protein